MSSSSPTTSTAQSQLPYREFVDSIRSPATRTLYIQSLHYLMDYLRIPRDNYDKLLDKDPRLIQMDITDFIKYLRSKNLSYATISSYVSAINKFYNMNDIINLNWKKIRSFLGEHERVAEDRPYTHSEIQTNYLSFPNYISVWHEESN